MRKKIATISAGYLVRLNGGMRADKKSGAIVDRTPPALR
jgi:hypothetical protein